MKRIGIDVGGTNTDAVLIEDDRVVAAVKRPTTSDVMTGLLASLRALKEQCAERLDGLDAVMIGTTHFVNAVVQRRGLTRIAAIRIGLPASQSLPPMVDWPEDLRAAVDPLVFMVKGGHEYDGREFMPLDEAAIREAATRIRDAGIGAVGICAAFSPLTSEHERRAGEIVEEVAPGASVTLSHTLGRIGLLERENVALINAALVELGRHTVSAFAAALADAALDVPFYLTQNDGTVAAAETAASFPVYSFASGPTNSMRGAAFLTAIEDAIVIDVGGTTSDIGCLVQGFPRQANNVVEVGGVRTLFRMPDLLSLGLGGGTIVDRDERTLGPLSVGFRLPQEGLVFGGNTLTATDIGVAGGLATIGDASRVAHLSRSFVGDMLEAMAALLTDGVDRLKTKAGDAVVIAAGGGAFLIPERLPGVSKTLHVEHAAVANAVGAAIAQISGEVDQIFTGLSRDAALAEAERIARDRAVRSGAARSSLKLVETEDIPISYLPGNVRRVRARVIGSVGLIA
ncbi:MAG: hydantoinase/oxoprolinase N-terminal domain-containing protein [Rhizobiaceae bacterium]